MLVVGQFALPHKASALLIAVLAVLLASLAISQSLAHLDPPAAYYGPPSRFWQFMIGALAALLPYAPRGRWQAELGAALGLVLLGASLALFSPEFPLPGLWSLLPTAGTALVLFCGRHDATSLTARLLSIWPAKWLGRISYSVYLWHWPLIVFYKLRVNAAPAGPEQICLLLVSVALGTLSYFTVERVFLRQPPGQKPSRLFGATLAYALLFCASALMLSRSDGFASRFADTVANYARYLDYDPKLPPRRAVLSRFRKPERR